MGVGSPDVMRGFHDPSQTETAGFPTPHSKQRGPRPVADRNRGVPDPTKTEHWGPRPLADINNAVPNPSLTKIVESPTGPR